MAHAWAAAAKDAGGSAVAGVKFLWQSSDHSVAVVDTAGVARTKGPGSAIVTAAARGVPGSAVLTVTQTPTHLAFSAQPSNVLAGEAFSPAVQVEIRDSAGALVAGARDAVTLSIGTNPGGGVLGGARTVNAVGGVATFSDVWIDKAGGNYTLSAVTSGTPAIQSAGFSVSPAAAARLAFVHSPADQLGNVAFPDTTEVDLYDRFGNLATGSADTVTLTIARDPWATFSPTSGQAFAATLSGTPRVAATGGRARFTNLVLDRPGAGYALGATLPNPLVSQATTASFTVYLEYQDPVAAGYYESCAPTSGSFYCWGGDSVPMPAPGGVPFVSLSMGPSHRCGLTASGIAYCWGDNSFGELGSGGSASLVPIAVQGGLTFIALDVGAYHTCAVATNGDAYCWGRGDHGQRGDGTSDQSQSTPTPVAGGLTFTAITAGTNMSCGVTSDSLAYCWGDASTGELGNAVTSGDFSSPQAVGGGLKFLDVQAGVSFACGLATTHYVYCWGSNFDNQLAMSSGSGLVQDSLPWPAGGAQATAIAIGDHHGCAVGLGTLLRCWGRNIEGQVGDGTTNNRDDPTYAVLSGVTSVSAGATHTCARSGTTLFCWGDNSFGELGDGARVSSLTPRLVVLQH